MPWLLNSRMALSLSKKAGPSQQTFAYSITTCSVSLTQFEDNSKYTYPFSTILSQVDPEYGEDSVSSSVLLDEFIETRSFFLLHLFHRHTHNLCIVKDRGGQRGIPVNFPHTGRLDSRLELRDYPMG